MKISAITERLVPSIQKLENKHNDFVSEVVNNGRIPIIAGTLVTTGMILDKCKKFFQSVRDNFFN